MGSDAHTRLWHDPKRSKRDWCCHQANASAPPLELLFAHHARPMLNKGDGWAATLVICSLVGAVEEDVKCSAMLVVHVHVRVKAEFIEAFRAATIENAHASLREASVAQFDVAQQQDDPTRFVLVEIYRDDAAPAKHKETAHYTKWRDTVAAMMAEPRTSVKYTNVTPV